MLRTFAHAVLYYAAAASAFSPAFDFGRLSSSRLAHHASNILLPQSMSNQYLGTAESMERTGMGAPLIADLEAPRMGDFSGSLTDIIYNNFLLELIVLLPIILALFFVALGDPKKKR